MNARSVVLAFKSWLRTIQDMFSVHRRRAFTLVETSVILMLFGVLASIAFVSYSTVNSRARAEASRHSVRTLIVSQQLRFTQRGSFVDVPTALTQLEPSWQYVAGGVEPPDSDSLSVTIGVHNELEAVSVVTTSGDTCVGAVAYPPALRDPAFAKWTRSPSDPCTADEMLTRQGDATW